MWWAARRLRNPFWPTEMEVAGFPRVTVDGVTGIATIHLMHDGLPNQRPLSVSRSPAIPFPRLRAREPNPQSWPMQSAGNQWKLPAPASMILDCHKGGAFLPTRILIPDPETREAYRHVRTGPVISIPSKADAPY